jgi:hypothetical protein
VYAAINVPLGLASLSQCSSENDLTDKLSWDNGQALLHFKALKSLMIHSRDEPFATCWISPGEQHHFVHDIYQRKCPTLQEVIFGPLMVWHLRAVPTGAVECHCELEMLSPRKIRRGLRSQMEEQVCDWRGTLARLLREEPSKFSEMEIGRIVKPEALSVVDVLGVNANNFASLSL